MKREKEIELKLQALDQAWWEKVEPHLLAMAVPGSCQAESFEASYYDTAQGHLRRAGFVYRVRREGDRWVATVKIEAGSMGGLSQRWEWNVPVEDYQPDISVFMGTEIGKNLKKALAWEKLVELFVTRFERRSCLLSLSDGSKIECAIDRGEIVAGDRREPIAELELELKDGELSALLELGNFLAAEYALVPETSSKFARGLRLAGLIPENEQD